MLERVKDVDTEAFTPRHYQVELLEKAIRHNLIISLPTGSGKTFIAVQLLKELCSLARYSSGAKRGFFLVPTVPLVEQQAKEIKLFTSFEVHGITDVDGDEIHGKFKFDYGNEEAWNKELDRCHVFVMTPQIFLNLLSHGYWSLERTSVLVLDECHHALGNHPYRQIMSDHYRKVPLENRPRVLGLTASAVHTADNINRLEERLKKLENVLNARLDVSSEYSELALYGAKPQRRLVMCHDFCDTTGLTDQVVEHVREASRFLTDADFDVESAGGSDPTKSVKTTFRRVLSVLKQLGPWCTWKVVERLERDLDKQPVVDELHRRFVHFGRSTLRHVRLLLDSQMRQVQTEKQLLEILPPRVTRLLDILKLDCLKKPPVSERGSRGPGEPDRVQWRAAPRNERPGPANAFCGIVFVKEKYVAFILNILMKHFIKHNPDSYGFIKTDYIIGYSNRQAPGRDNHDEHDTQAQSQLRRQDQVLREFRNPSAPLNLLIATSVIEEGIHVGQVNCVVRFDAPEDYRAYVQSKGRARREGSFMFMLVETSNRNIFERRLRNYDQIEEFLRKHCRNRLGPIRREVNREQSTDDLETFYPKISPEAIKSGRVKGKPCVTAGTAIALINRYCGCLPSDSFTRLAPIFKIIEEIVPESRQPLFRAELQLPINSPLKETIQTKDLFLSKWEARRAVALATCKLLYERGELNDNLIPVGRESLIELMRLQDADDEVDSALWRSGGPPPGSTRRRQYYDKRIATTLHDTAPGADMPLFLHRITLRLVKAAEGKSENPKDRKYRDPASSSQCFGVLSSKKLPILPSFPIYGRPGELQCSFDLQPETVQLSKQDLDQACKFHEIVFAELLKLDRQHMRFDAQQEFASNGLLLVPLSCTSDSELNAVRVDLAFITEIISSEVPKPLTEEQQQNFVYDESRYEDAIVVPWYRNREKPQFYFVAQILHERSPQSSFPDDDYVSFVDYFYKKYNGLKIHHVNQPLIDADYTSQRLNLLTSRQWLRKPGVTSTSSANSQQTQILIPELMDIHPMSATLWNMLVCLPSVLYRLNYLLVADELRCAIQKEALGVDDPQPRAGDSWEPLAFPARTQRLEAYFEQRAEMEEEEVVEQQRKKKKSPVKLEEKTEATTSSTSKSNSDTLVEAYEYRESDDFVIDVWDPTMGEGLEGVDLCAPTPSPHTVNSTFLNPGGVPEAPTTAKEPPPTRQQGEDDLWNKEFDEGNIHFELVPKEIAKELDDLAQPREECIISTGWEVDGAMGGPLGDDEAIGVQSISLGPTAHAFSPQAATALLDDLRNLGDPTTSTTANVNVQPRMNGLQRVNVPQSTVSGLADDTAFSAPTFSSQDERVGLPEDTAVPRCAADVADENEISKLVQELTDSGATDDVDRRKRRVEDDPGEALSLDLLGAAGDESEDSCSVEPEEQLQGVLNEDEELNDGTTSSAHLEERQDVRSPTDSMSTASVTDREILEDDQYGDSTPGHSRENSQAFKEYLEFFEANNLDSNRLGPSPSLILQALTMSNASDGFNLERLETVGDSFLKYAITVQLFISHPVKHEGKLSWLRSKFVSNYNLYKQGKAKGFGEILVSTKFEPTNNWLPPGYLPLEHRWENAGTDEQDRELEKHIDVAETADDLSDGDSSDAQKAATSSKTSKGGDTSAVATNLVLKPPAFFVDSEGTTSKVISTGAGLPMLDTAQSRPSWFGAAGDTSSSSPGPADEAISACMLTQHLVADKSIADAVEALIGVYLLTYGPHPAMLFMQWLGLKVFDEGCTEFKQPSEPLLRVVSDPEGELHARYLRGQFSMLERQIGYTFHNKAYLVQAFTHGSYSIEGARVTDCYQRLEFLGDAVLDYLITRYLYEDKRQHLPGVLTDLRSALVNNTIFASLAVQHGFQKYFLVVESRIKRCIKEFALYLEKHGTDVNFNTELALVESEELEDGGLPEDANGESNWAEEKFEIPKSMGDVFEALAGAIFLDSGLSIAAVWTVYHRLMQDTIETCCANPPKSPIRELLELEPETAKFLKSERLSESKKVKVTVVVKGKGSWTGIGRNYRTAKSTAAKRALKKLKENMQS